MLEPGTQATTGEATDARLPVRWADIPVPGQKAILSLLDRVIRRIPGALERAPEMTPEERERRKLEIQKEWGRRE